MKNIRIITVKDNNIRLDRYIRRTFPNLGQSLIEKLLRNKLIKIDGCKAKSRDRVTPGQVITIKNLIYTDSINYIYRSNKKNEELVDLLRKSILYEDEYLLAINKPTGIVVQGGTKIKVSISDLLDQIREGEMLKVVHRLDKDTSGVMIFARDANVAKFLIEEFRARRVKKTYLALTSGIPLSNKGIINCPLIKKYVSGQEKVVVDRHFSSQNAVTYFSIVKKLEQNIAYLKLQPITGRTHQLRVHLAHINCPILGDGKYGGKKAFIKGLVNKIHLHSRSLSLRLPNRKKTTIFAFLPKHFTNSLKTLKYTGDEI